MSAAIIDLAEARGRNAPRLPASVSTISRSEAVDMIERLPEREKELVMFLLKMLKNHNLQMKSRNRDKRILQAEKRAVEVVKFWNSLDADGTKYGDAFSDVLGDLTRECYELIGSTPAKTPAAMAAKVRLIQEWSDNLGTGWVKDGMETLLSDLDRMAEGGAS